jgi:hypothetical protein
MNQLNHLGNQLERQRRRKKFLILVQTAVVVEVEAGTVAVLLLLAAMEGVEVTARSVAQTLLDPRARSLSTLLL